MLATVLRMFPVSWEVIKKHEPQVDSLSAPHLTSHTHTALQGAQQKLLKHPPNPPGVSAIKHYFFVLSPKKHRTTTTDTTQNMLTQHCQAYLNVSTIRFYETMPSCGLIFTKLKPQSAVAIQK